MNDSERKVPLIYIEEGFAFGITCSLGLIFTTIVVCTSWYKFKELDIKYTALMHGTPALEVQCIFPGEKQEAACLILLGAKK